MKKLLFLIIVMVATTAIVIFSIPVLRNIVLNPFLREKALSVAGLDREIMPAGSGAPENNSAPVTFTEPGIERIREDLIGRKIPGWSFDKVTEFRKSTISSIARTGQRIDFQVDLQMLPYNTADNSFYYAQVVATYLAGNEDWYLEKVDEIFLSYEILVPPGRWIYISSPEGCSLEPESRSRLTWTSKSWDYEVLSGPGIGVVTLPAAGSYEVKSVSKKSVKVKLTFRPGS